MALAAARAFIGGGDQAAQFAQTIQRAIQVFNCSDGLQATLAGLTVSMAYTRLLPVCGACCSSWWALCSDGHFAGASSQSHAYFSSVHYYFITSLPPPPLCMRARAAWHVSVFY
jgi:hypothetical protein